MSKTTVEKPLRFQDLSFQTFALTPGLLIERGTRKICNNTAFGHSAHASNFPLRVQYLLQQLAPGRGLSKLPENCWM